MGHVGNETDKQEVMKMDANKAKYIIENATEITTIKMVDGMIYNQSYQQFIEFNTGSVRVKVCVRYQSKITIGDFGNGDELVIDNARGEHVFIAPFSSIVSIDAKF